jgi:hypothetical protein
MEKTRKVTIRFPVRLRTEMQYAIVQSRYGLRGKSRWLSSAIQGFIRQTGYVDLVEHGDRLNQAELTEVEAFYLNESTLDAMKSALVKVRGKYPLFEGVQSAFIRACVTWYLLQAKNSPGGKFKSSS